MLTGNGAVAQMNPMERFFTTSICAEASAEDKYDLARDYAARREALIERLEAAMRTGDYAAAKKLQSELKMLNSKTAREDG